MASWSLVVLAAALCCLALPSLPCAQGPEAELSEEEEVLVLRDEPIVYRVGGDLGWAIQQYEDIPDAIVGDALEFVYNSFHTVWMVPERQCNFEEGTELGGKVDSPFEYVLEEPGVYHFSDIVPGKCEAGKLFSVTVNEVP